MSLAFQCGASGSSPNKFVQ